MVIQISQEKNSKAEVLAEMAIGMDQIDTLNFTNVLNVAQAKVNNYVVVVVQINAI